MLGYRGFYVRVLGLDDFFVDKWGSFSRGFKEIFFFLGWLRVPSYGSLGNTLSRF